MAKSIELNEKKNGFSERDLYSKAILNTDSDSLLKYKIQKNRYKTMNNNSVEIETMKRDIDSMKNQLDEIKSLLLQITAGK